MEYTVKELLNKYPFNAAKLAEYVGIHDALLRYYKTNARAYMSDERRQELEDALHRLGAELQQIKLK